MNEWKKGSFEDFLSCKEEREREKSCSKRLLEKRKALRENWTGFYLFRGVFFRYIFCPVQMSVFHEDRLFQLEILTNSARIANLRIAIILPALSDHHQSHEQ